MDMSSVMGLVSGLKASKDLATAALQLTTDTQVIEKLNKLVHEVSNVQGNLLQAQVQTGALVQAKHELEGKVRELEAELEKLKKRQQQLDQYELTKVAVQSFLYRYTGDGPEHFACTRCFSEGLVHVLQIKNWHTTHYGLKCPKCETHYVGPVNPNYKPPAPRVRSPGLGSETWRTRDY